VDQKPLFHKPEDAFCCIGEGHGCNLHIHPSLHKKQTQENISIFLKKYVFKISQVHLGKTLHTETFCPFK